MSSDKGNETAAPTPKAQTGGSAEKAASKKKAGAAKSETSGVRKRGASLTDTGKMDESSRQTRTATEASRRHAERTDLGRDTQALRRKGLSLSRADRFAAKRSRGSKWALGATLVLAVGYVGTAAIYSMQFLTTDATAANSDGGQNVSDASGNLLWDSDGTPVRVVEVPGTLSPETRDAVYLAEKARREGTPVGDESGEAPAGTMAGGTRDWSTGADETAPVTVAADADAVSWSAPSGAGVSGGDLADAAARAEDQPAEDWSDEDVAAASDDAATDTWNADEAATASDGAAPQEWTADEIAAADAEAQDWTEESAAETGDAGNGPAQDWTAEEVAAAEDETSSQEWTAEERAAAESEGSAQDWTAEDMAAAEGDAATEAAAQDWSADEGDGSGDTAQDSVLTASVQNAIDAAQAGPDCVTRVATLADDLTLTFGVGSITPEGAALERAREMAEAAAACPEAVVTVEGHSDATGGNMLNMELSWTRAENTIGWFAERDIDTEGFRPLGFGTRNPAVEGDSDQAHAANRRVEFSVARRAVAQN